MKIVFLGTSPFAAFILEQMVQKGHIPVAIVTRPDRVQGRKLHLSPPPVKEKAQVLCPGVPLFQPEKASTPEFVATLSALKPDLFVVVAYGEIIKQDLLDVPSLGCVNIHASLLPRFRGAAPMQRALMSGEKETGITLILMTSKMDAGDIVVQEAIPLPHEMTLGELELQLRALAAQLLLQVIAQCSMSRITGTPQDVSLVTFAPKITPEEEKIDWTRSAEEIHNQVRALSPVPGAWCVLQVGSERKRLKIKKTRVRDLQSAHPGEILHFNHEKGWIVGCGRQALQLLLVQLEGKKEMAAEECLRGFRQSVFIE